MKQAKTPHWNYYLALEQDVLSIALYVELDQRNFKTFSVEIARLLMSATQELDVVLKQLCARHNDSAKSESGYRAFLSTKYPAWLSLTIEMPAYGLSFKPFASWETSQTASWWTANNKVKHERHTHFDSASIENMLNAVAALFIANIYLHSELNLLKHFTFGARLCRTDCLIDSIALTDLGNVPNYTTI